MGPSQPQRLLRLSLFLAASSGVYSGEVWAPVMYHLRDCERSFHTAKYMEIQLEVQRYLSQRNMLPIPYLFFFEGGG